MHAELNSRLSAASPTNPSVQRLDMAPRRPLRWPSSLNNLARSERSVALVLSPICASCVGVAASLNSFVDGGGFGPDIQFGLLVSAPNLDSGEAFVRDHELSRLELFIDVGGNWVRENLRVSTSPAALLLRRGEFTDACSFSDLDSLGGFIRSSLSRYEETSSLTSNERETT